MIGQNYLCVYTQKAIWKNENFNQSCPVKVRSLSCIRIFMIPKTVAYQAPSIHGIFQARVLEWVAISFSRGNSRPRGRTRVYPHCRQTLYCLSRWGSLRHLLLLLPLSLQSCPTLCDPTDRSQPGSPVPGILQARTLEWVAISFSNAWKWNMKVKSLSHVRLLVTPWTSAYQAPASIGFSRQEYWSGLPFPSPEEIPDPGIKPGSIHIVGRCFTIWATREASIMHCCCCCQVASVVSDSVRPHRWQPTRLPHPWDSPGRNTGVGCHCLLQCVKVKRESEVAQCVRLLAPNPQL